MTRRGASRSTFGHLGPVLALAILLAVASGCDRTRPLPGSEPVVSGGATAAAPAPATPVAPAAGPVRTEEGWKFTFTAPGAGSVHLAGTFNDWSTTADPLVQDENGVWFIVKKLPPGTYQYKFVVDGTQWKEDPANPNQADDGFGGKNSVLQVP